MLYLRTGCPLRPSIDDAVTRARYQAVVDLTWFHPAVAHLFAHITQVVGVQLPYTSEHVQQPATADDQRHTQSGDLRAQTHAG